MKYNIFLMIFIGILFLSVGVALEKVGKIPECINEPYNFGLPIGIFFWFIIIFVWGWFSAYEHYKNPKQ